MSILVGFTSIASAQVNVGRVENGSGQPNQTGVENAVKWDSNVYHVPQYMPGYPTASTIFPRVIDLACTQTGSVVNCNGYSWAPNMGRGEYLMVRPVITESPKPIIVTNTIVKEVFVTVPTTIPVTEKKIKE